MPIKTEVDHTKRLVHFELSGDLDTGEMLAAVDDALAQVDGRRGYNFLSDNRKLLHPATPEQIKTLVSRLQLDAKVVEGSRCAVIVAHEASYGMIRMLGAHAERIGISVGAFWTEPEARAFLGQANEGSQPSP